MRSRQRNCKRFLSKRDADLKATATDIEVALDELLLSRPVTKGDIIQAYRRMAKRFQSGHETMMLGHAYAERTGYRL